MGFTEAIKTCYKKSFTIDGCADRSEYWWFYLYQMIGTIASIIIFAILAGIIGDNPLYAIAGAYIGMFLFSLVNAPASICAVVRRLHDADKSGAFFFVNFIPFGVFYLIYLLILESEPESRYKE